jgi:hypothetical protein
MAITDPIRNFGSRLSKGFENRVVSVMRKYGFASTGGVGIGQQDPEPPYERAIPYQYVYRLRRNQAIVNNSIEEKVTQTFRRGFTEWEKSYFAKCRNCSKEFETLEPFRDQMGDEGDEIEDDEFDFSKERPCPNCDELADFRVPDPIQRDELERFWQNANEQGEDDSFLDGEHQNSIGQTVEEVFREIALDIQSFDDGWLIFQRSYYTDSNGAIQDWELDQIHRGAPEVMRYSFNEEEQQLGHERWICIECRATNDHYEPQKEAGSCKDCGNKTYMAYAKRLEQNQGEPLEYYIRGEFSHGSEYHPSKFYGYSPIISIYEQARTLEQMNNWYKSAYEYRRAPRGALVIRSSNAESVRAWNQNQMERLREDPDHIPTFMDDTEGQGDPLTWQPLLEDPAAMQNMKMRNWFLDRISAKYGVTSVFQSASPSPSGLSQSMEIVVSNRSAQKLKQVFEDIFIPALLTQLQSDGWEKHIKRIEEEDEAAEAQRTGTELRNAQLATQLNMDAEWTPDDTLDVKSGIVEGEEDPEQGMMPGMGGMGGMGGEGEEGDEMGGLFGSDSDNAAGETSTAGGRPYEPNQMAGAPRTQQDPDVDNPVKADNALTTQSEGASNATYGGGVEPVINLFDHLQGQLDEDATPYLDDSDIKSQAASLYEQNYGVLGLSADTIREYADDSSKEFQDLRDDNYGRWTRHPVAEKVALKLYQMHQ